MHRCLALISFFVVAIALKAAELPVTPFTVIAQVTTFEHYRAPGSPDRYSLDAPHGNEGTIVATILHPAALAGREVAIPYESKRGGKEQLVRKRTFFRFEHTSNLADLRNQTDWVGRRTIAFPKRGILVIKPDGRVVEAYAGGLSASK